MKTQTNFLMILAGAVMAFAMIGCGGSSGSGSPTVATTTAYGASCGTNMIQSQYGCLPQCAGTTTSVMYNGQCVPVTGVGMPSVPGMPGYPGTGANPQICQGNCPPGLVSVQGGFACLPQNSCGPCYGYYNGMCYIGDYAHQYYGY